MQKKRQTGLIISERSSDEIQKEEESPIDSDPIEVCAIDLLKAIIAKDVKGMASAIRSAFEILESQPHEENDFKSQNEKAAIDEGGY